MTILSKDPATHERWANGITLSGSLATFSGAPAPKPRPSTNLFAVKAAPGFTVPTPNEALAAHRRRLAGRPEPELSGFLDPFAVYAARKVAEHG